jgi:hypothetical protein
MTTRTEAVLRYADKIIENELAFHREYRPELLAALPVAELEAYKKGERIKAYSLADEIDDRQLCFLRHQRCGFDTSNNWTRRLFVDLTGIPLPSTNRETDIVLRQYCGEVCVGIEAEQQREREAKEQAKQAAEQVKRDTIKAKLSARVAVNESISGEELAELCSMLGIELHPRTIGLLRKRVRAINSGSASIVGKGLSDAAYGAYLSCAARVSA